MTQWQRVRIADGRVYRPLQAWTPTVHAFLDHLHAVGFDRVPRPLGVVDGWEVLSYIEGESGPAGWAKVVPPRGLRAFARLLREFHDATRGYVGEGWSLEHGTPAEVICHGDFGPWNVVWRGDDPVAVLDFDLAGPGTRLDDVAYALAYVVPFRDDETAVEWMGHPGPPDRADRLRVFAGAYGIEEPDLVAAVIRRQETTVTQVRALAERGVEPQRTWVANGYLDELAARTRWSREHRAMLG